MFDKASVYLKRFQTQAIWDTQLFPIALNLEKNAKEILQEFESAKENLFFKPIQAVSKAQYDLTDGKNQWKTLFLLAYGYWTKESDFFPVLSSILQAGKPKVISAFFSKLESGASLPTHTGKYNGILRIQLGVDVKEPDKTALIVEEQTINLKEKEVIVFDDSLSHSAKNESQHDRIVLIIDIQRPLPFPYHLLNLWAIRSIKKSNYVQEAIKNLSLKKSN